MRDLKLFFLLLLSLFVVTSCSVTGDESEEEITTENLVCRTDQTSYTAQFEENLPPAIYGFTIIARLENNSGLTVYLNRCNTDSPQPIYGLPLIDADPSKKSGYSRVYACASHSSPIEVESGTVRIDTLYVQGPSSWQQNSNEPIGELEGMFRLRYAIQTCRSGDGCELPDSLSQSNEFEVQLEE